MNTFKRWVFNLILIISLSTTAFTCENINPQGEDKILKSLSEDCGEAVQPLPQQVLNSDPFSLEEVKIEGNCLKITITRGGGCKEANFQLFQASGIMESYPPQMKLFLKLENDDPCFALITQDYYFNLESLELPKETNTIIFRLEGYPHSLTYEY